MKWATPVNPLQPGGGPPSDRSPPRPPCFLPGLGNVDLGNGRQTWSRSGQVHLTTNVGVSVDASLIKTPPSSEMFLGTLL